MTWYISVLQMLLQHNYILMQKKKEKKVLLRSVSAV